MSPPRVLLIDNYDSFTYNLYQYLCELGADVTVVRNDAITVEEVRQLKPDAIVISPGPGVPRDAGISVELVRALGPTMPILGVCLGHQAIAEAFGGVITRAPELMHGKASDIHHDGSGVFAGLPSPFSAIRYHSLCAAPEAVPDSLVVTARTKTGVIMAVKHREYPVHGVQFHPESILSEHGKDLLANFLRSAGGVSDHTRATDTETRNASDLSTVGATDDRDTRNAAGRGTVGAADDSDTRNAAERSTVGAIESAVPL